jgi:Outer membrane protein beta-barrel domain
VTKRWVVAVLSAAAMAASTGVLAQQSGASSPFYVGLDVGNADFGSDDDTAFKLFAGFQFHPNVAAEVAYSMLYDKGGSEANALEIVAVPMFPVANRFSVFGKFGFAHIDNDPGDRDTEITYGVGVQFDATPKLGVRAQWQRYETDQEIDLLSVGVVVKF